jgi:hypothetical protein
MTLGMKWKDRKDVSFISTFHDLSVATKTVRGVDVTNPKYISCYSLSVLGADLKGQMQQLLFLTKRKGGMKWYMKLFRHLLNDAICNAYIV